MDATAAELTDHLRNVAGDRMRAAISYDGEEYDVLYRRDDVEAAFTEDEFAEVVKSLILKGYDDAPEQPEFTRFGHLDVTVRWFHDVVVVHVPFGDWTGLMASFDRDGASCLPEITATIVEYVEDPENEIPRPEYHEGVPTEDDVESRFS